MNVKQYKVTGSHCMSCKLIIENTLNEDNRISKVTMEPIKGDLEVEFKDNEVPFSELEKTIDELGYKLHKSSDEIGEVNSSTNSALLFSAVFIVPVLIGAIFFFSTLMSTEANTTELVREEVPSTYEELVKEEGMVGVKVQPKLVSSSENSVFFVLFNTHSVDLDFDFDQIIVLQDDLGNIYDAIEWTGNRGWHHVNGDIIFPPINSDAEEVTLTIKGIEDIDRVFTWELIK